MVAALASWLDARAQGGTWLVRIEDVDSPRCVAGADRLILQQLADCSLHPDEAPTWQSQHQAWYEQALDQLIHAGAAYPCHCSRKDIEAVWLARGVSKTRHQALVYPGTCRDASATTGSHASTHAKPPAWRLRVPAGTTLHWQDRRLGCLSQSVNEAVGDFVLKRADGLWSYQLAVVCDDARQGITHVVRGEDLADNTPRQIVLQQCLQLPTPVYLHTPLVVDEAGEKLSKQQGAQPVNTACPLAVLNQAAQCLGLPEQGGSPAEALQQWVHAWRATTTDLYNPGQHDPA